jgi:hypothetical protein
MLILLIPLAVAAAFILTATYEFLKVIQNGQHGAKDYLAHLAKDGLKYYYMVVIMAVLFLISCTILISPGKSTLAALILLALAAVAGGLYIFKSRVKLDKKLSVKSVIRLVGAAVLIALLAAGGYFAGTGILAMLILLTPLISWIVLEAELPFHKLAATLARNSN